MINFEKYIKEALYDFDFFIVPGLGAFIASFAQASIDDSGQLIEPVKSFTFNGFLLADDEKKFINYVLKQEHKPTSEVELQLKEFVFQLKSSVNRGESVFLADDCVLTFDEESGTIIGRFTAERNYYGKTDFEEDRETPVLPIAQTQPEIQEIEQQEREDSTEAENEEVIALDSSAAEITTKEHDGEVVNDQLSEIEDSYDESYEESERKWGRYLIYILPLLLIFGGLYYVILKKPFEKDEAISSQDAEVAVVVSDDSVSTDIGTFEDSTQALAEESDQPEPMRYREGRISDQRKYPFEVAAGLFKSKTNADRLLEKMKNAGFNAEIRLVNGMRRVYVGVNTTEEAEAMSNKIEEFTGLTSVYFDENGVSNK